MYQTACIQLIKLTNQLIHISFEIALQNYKILIIYR